MLAMISALFINGVPVECINNAAIAFHVPAVIIASVLTVENGKAGMATPNKNGTYDYGSMQINSVWLNQLTQYGYSKEEIKNNPCTNVWIGTWILSQKLATGKDFWHGIGGYNSFHLPQNYSYQKKVARTYYALVSYLSNPL
ncbi:MAG: lytic transglycosylase domain-containing protein [Gammaproteobacteria bacterium]